MHIQARIIFEEMRTNTCSLMCRIVEIKQSVRWMSPHGGTEEHQERRSAENMPDTAAKISKTPISVSEQETLLNFRKKSKYRTVNTDTLQA